MIANCLLLLMYTIENSFDSLSGLVGYDGSDERMGDCRFRLKQSSRSS